MGTELRGFCRKFSLATGSALRQHQGHDLAECQREGPVLRNDISAAIQGSGWGVAQRHLIRSE
jgi:hypothetical protein